MAYESTYGKDEEIQKQYQTSTHKITKNMKTSKNIKSIKIETAG